MAERDNRRANIIVARIIPLLLVGIVGYTTYVMTVLICVKYLLKPPVSSGQNSRHGAAIAILVIYYLLLFPMVVSFFRLLSTIWTNPGYVPLGPRRHLDDTKSGRSSEKGLGKDRRTSRTNRQGGHQGSHGGGQIDADNWSVSTDPPPGLERHYQYDVFVCENTGRPIYCQYCQNWKPDRAHHCSELNRCILKMDHFCPWVGGMVSEYSFKWFIQFTSYASIFCIFTLISIAIFTAERAKRFPLPNVHWMVVLALAALLGLMATGMSLGSIHLALVNSTTVENLTRKSKVTQLAVLIPSMSQLASVEGLQTQPSIPYATITYPLEPMQGPVGTQASRTTPKRTFAVLKTRPGENIWDLGYYENWRSVMGMRIWDWFLPFKPSPCQNHDRGESSFQLGPAIDRIRREAGFLPNSSNVGKSKQRHRRKKSRRSRASSSVSQKDFRSDAQDSKAVNGHV